MSYWRGEPYKFWGGQRFTEVKILKLCILASLSLAKKHRNQFHTQYLCIFPNDTRFVWQFFHFLCEFVNHEIKQCWMFRCKLKGWESFLQLEDFLSYLGQLHFKLKVELCSVYLKLNPIVKWIVIYFRLFNLFIFLKICISFSWCLDYTTYLPLSLR